MVNLQISKVEPRANAQLEQKKSPDMLRDVTLLPWRSKKLRF